MVIDVHNDEGRISFSLIKSDFELRAYNTHFFKVLKIRIGCVYLIAACLFKVLFEVKVLSIELGEYTKTTYNLSS